MSEEDVNPEDVHVVSFGPGRDWAAPVGRLCEFCRGKIAASTNGQMAMIGDGDIIISVRHDSCSGFRSQHLRWNP